MRPITIGLVLIFLRWCHRGDAIPRIPARPKLTHRRPHHRWNPRHRNHRHCLHADDWQGRSHTPSDLPPNSSLQQTTTVKTVTPSLRVIHPTHGATTMKTAVKIVLSRMPARPSRAVDAPTPTAPSSATHHWCGQSVRSGFLQDIDGGQGIPEFAPKPPCRPIPTRLPSRRF